MKGYIVQANYDESYEKTLVQIYGRLENSKSFGALITLKPYFFIKESDVKKVKPYISKYEVEDTSLTTFAKEPVVKVTHNLQSELNKLIVHLHEQKIDTYESDLKPHQRFIIDNNILGCLEIKGESQPAERLDSAFIDPVVKNASYTPELNVLSIDIESDKDTNELLCVSLYAKNYKKVFMITNKKLENATSCSNEADCLEKFKEAILKLDPDIITGWNVADFDFPYLKERFEKNKIRFDIGRDNTEVRMRIIRDFFKKSTITIGGRQVLDALYMIRDPFIKEAPSIRNIDIESWTLEDVSRAILNDGKLLTGKDRHEEIVRLYKTNSTVSLQKLVDYNLKDAQLAYQLLEKTHTLELAVERSQLTGLTLDRITASIAALDSLYIRAARSRGLVSPTTRYSNKEESIKGGYVRDSTPGIYHDLLVLDFKSLYPSIIKTFNIDPSSYVIDPAASGEKNLIQTANGAQFRNTEGILPEIISKLHEAREKAKREKREFASYAIKIIMNSFFGVLASPNCRYFSLEMANAITHSAQSIIKQTAQKIEEKGYKVIYSDTDSVFLEAANEKNPEKLGKELEEYINTFYRDFIKKKYNRTSYLELEFKRHYIAFMMPTTRGTDKGSKKRYAGLYKNKGKEELEIVGLEAVRGDWTDAAQEFQRELLMKIFRREEFIAFIKQYVKKLKDGKLDSKLVYRKSIRKALDKYTKTTPPHVKAARLLDNLQSSTIEYYITTSGPEPLQKLTHAIDYDHYIEKQIKPLADAVLHFFNKKFEDIIKETKQTKLFG